MRWALGLSIIGLLLAMAAPAVVSIQTLHVLIMTAFAGTLALSWNFVGGMGGQMLLSLSLFVGIGAYTSTILYLYLGLTPWIGMIVGAVLAACAGALIGYVVFSRRLIGVYFALATLAINEMALYLAANWDAIGGANGLIIPPRVGALAFQFPTKAPYFYVMGAILAVTATTSILVHRGPTGIMLAAIRQNEQAAAALGVNVTRLKVIATALSAGFAALAGTFYAQYVLFVDPDSVLGLSLTIDALVYSFIGGVGTALGPLVGAVIMVPILDALIGSFGGTVPGLHLIVYGIVIILVMRFAPRGILAVARGQFARYRSRGSH